MFKCMLCLAEEEFSKDFRTRSAISGPVRNKHKDVGWAKYKELYPESLAGEDEPQGKKTKSDLSSGNPIPNIDAIVNAVSEKLADQLGLVTERDDAEALSKFVKELSPAELRVMLREKEMSTIDDPLLRSFQLMDDGMTAVDVMSELDFDFEKMSDYLGKYNRMKELENERHDLREPYLKSWFDLGKTIGRHVRDGCEHYNNVNGRCDKWEFEHVDKSYRDRFKGVYKQGRKTGEGLYVNADRHPEVCSICYIGVLQNFERGERT